MLSPCLPVRNPCAILQKRRKQKKRIIKRRYLVNKYKALAKKQKLIILDVKLESNINGFIANNSMQFRKFSVCRRSILVRENALT